MVKIRSWRTSEHLAGLGYCFPLISGLLRCQVGKTGGKPNDAWWHPWDFIKIKWIGANLKGFVFTNLHLLAKIQVAPAERCGGKGLICGVPVILSSSYSSWVRLWEEQMGTDFLIWEALVSKYFIVLQNIVCEIENHFKLCISRRMSSLLEAQKAIRKRVGETFKK